MFYESVMHTIRYKLENKVYDVLSANCPHIILVIMEMD